MQTVRIQGEFEWSEAEVSEITFELYKYAYLSHSQSFETSTNELMKYFELCPGSAAHEGTAGRSRKGTRMSIVERER